MDIIGELLDDSKDKAKITILFQTLDAYLDLKESQMDLNTAFKYFNAIKFNDLSCVCLLELIIKRLSREDFSAFLLSCEQTQETRMQDDEKFLATLCLLVARINLEDYESLEIVDKTNGTNVLDRILIFYLNRSILSLNENVRALTVRCIGLSTIISKHISQSFISIIHNVLIYLTLKSGVDLSCFNLLIFFFLKRLSSPIIQQ